MDLSLNHGAIVELIDGNINDICFWTNKAGQSKMTGGTRLSIIKSEDRQNVSVRRLVFIRDYLKDQIENRKPDYVGIEDYAIRAEQGAHYLGEAGGIARTVCWDAGVKLRLHDPCSVKMFATLNGNCPKENVAPIVRERWGLDFTNFCPESKKGGAEDTTTSGDITDAYILARLVWTEVQLRAGTFLLSSLIEEKERRVFQRMTKTYPVNLLDREWICR